MNVVLLAMHSVVVWHVVIVSKEHITFIFTVQIYPENKCNMFLRDFHKFLPDHDFVTHKPTLHVLPLGNLLIA